MYQQAQSYYHGMKAHINLRQEPLTKILYKKPNFKKVGFSTMAFTAKILSWRFRHLNIVGCLRKRRPTKEGSRAPQDPPLATPLILIQIIILIWASYALSILTRFHLKMHNFHAFQSFRPINSIHTNTLSIFIKNA